MADDFIALPSAKTKGAVRARSRRFARLQTHGEALTWDALFVNERHQDETHSMSPKYRYWREQPLWTLTQAAYLLAGLPPVDDPSDAWVHPPRRAVTFHERIKMAVATGDLKPTFNIDGVREKLVKPHDVVRWAQAMRYRLPSPFRELAGIPSETNPLKTLEKLTLLRLIGGMAAAKYSWRPGVRGSASKDIAEDLDKLGIALTDETIHKWLSVAADYLPPLPPLPAKRT